MSSKKKAGFRLQRFKNGDIYGDSGVCALDNVFLQIGKEKIPTWKILREVDLDGSASTNFDTVDILKNMEDLDSYQRGFSQAAVQLVIRQLH